MNYGSNLLIFLIAPVEEVRIISTFISIIYAKMVSLQSFENNIFRSGKEISSYKDPLLPDTV